MNVASDVDVKRLVVAALAEANVPAALIADYLAGRTDVPMADLGLDSLASMEFCIAIELSTGVPIVPDELHALGTLGRVADSVRARLA